VWHIIEDAAIYGALPAPAGVAPGDWAGVGAHDWGRRAIRMLRPKTTPWIDDAQALWKDFAPDAALELRWSDGSTSPFEIGRVSPAAERMTFTIAAD